MNELKSWSDLASKYDMVLFNNVWKLEDVAIWEDYMEQHTCEAQDAQYHIESCEIEGCKKCKELKHDFGDYPECECEPYQTYAIDVSESDVEYLNKEFDLDIFYSGTLDMYLLPVYHFGTSWRIMGLKGGYVNV